MTSGPQKSTDTHFLDELLDEVEYVLQNGMEIGGRLVQIKLHSMPLDAQASALVKATKAVNSYYGCDKCNQEGEWFEGRVTFPRVDGIPKTDECFRNKQQPYHHNGDSAFLRFIVNMHLFSHCAACIKYYLGVLRRLMNVWKGGLREVRLGAEQLELIDQRIRTISRCVTQEFPRKPRGFHHLRHLKAAEFRSLLLYCLPIALQNVLRDDMYEHFCVSLVEFPYFHLIRCQKID
jgi:hypothetical protein